MTIRESALQHMAAFLRQPLDRFQEETVLTTLVSDSMILINMVIDLQEELGIRLVHEDLQGVKTVGQLLKVIEKKSPGSLSA